MARPQKLIPAYRKHRASGQAVCTLNGKDHYLGPHGTKASKLAYDRLIAEFLSSGRSSTFGNAASELTVVELAADYLTYAKSYYGTGASSECHRVLAVIRPLRELYGRIPAADFGPLQLKALRAVCIKAGWSRSYVNANMRRVVRIFRWAGGEGRVSPLVYQALALVPGLRAGRCDARESEPVRPVDDAIVEATLPHLPAVVADMVRIQRLAGCRPAEVCLIRPCDIERSADVWLYRPQHHKTQHHGRERVILIGPRAQDCLLRYLARDASTYCFRPCDSMKKYFAAKLAARKTPLSCGNRPGSNRKRRPRKAPGEKYDTCSYRRAINRACDRAFPHPTLAAIPQRTLTPEQLEEIRKWQSANRWAPNQLRHAAATEVRSKFGLEAAQVILGHSEARVTQVYAERDIAKGIAVARAMG